MEKDQIGEETEEAIANDHATADSPHWELTQLMIYFPRLEMKYIPTMNPLHQNLHPQCWRLILEPREERKVAAKQLRQISDRSFENVRATLRKPTKSCAQT